MRRPLIAGNWKMFKTTAEARELVNGLKESLAGAGEVKWHFARRSPPWPPWRNWWPGPGLSWVPRTSFGKMKGLIPVKFPA